MIYDEFDLIQKMLKSNFAFFSRYVSNIQQTQIQTAQTTNDQRPENRTQERVLQNRVLQERVVAMQHTTIHHTPLIIPTHIPITQGRIQEKTTIVTTGGV